jgi:integrase/recombinase XerD
MSTDFVAHFTSESTLEPAIRGWEMYLHDQGKSINTIKAFRADIRLLKRYLPKEKSIGSITTTEINDFLDWMQNDRGKPCSPKTLSRRITSIKSFFRWLANYGVILVDPAEKVVQKSVISPLPEALTIGETDKILEVANRYRTADEPDARYFALVTLLLETGIKKGECLRLEHEHVFIDPIDEAYIFVKYASQQYRYKERKIPVSQEWVSGYLEYKSQYDQEDEVFPWSPRRLEYLLEDLSNEAGLEKHLSFDMCRWTSALIDWQTGVEHNKIRQKLGISKVQWREVNMKLGRLDKKYPSG